VQQAQTVYATPPIRRLVVNL